MKKKKRERSKNDQHIDEPKTQPQPITKQHTYPKKTESKTRKTTLATLKTPNHPNNDTKGVDVSQRTIAVANVAVINNHRITTPVTFQFRPPNNTSEFSVSKVHQKTSKQ